MKKKDKLTKMGVNIFYLELMLIFINSDLIFEEKRQEALEKKLGCKFIKINTSNAKNGFDLDHEVGNIEAFIHEFKNKKNEKTRRQNKRKRRKIKQKK